MDRDGAVTLSVLGYVRAWRDGAELELGGPQQRAALALLLAGDGRPVPLEVFFDALWHGEPPPTAGNVVHRLISRLRRVLEPERVGRGASRWIARVPGGYRLTAGPESLDLTRFRRLVEQARGLADAFDVHGATLAYKIGLDLWQGPAAAGIDSGVRAHPQIAALDREWAAAVRVAADLALSCGDAELMLPAVARAADAEPLDESLRARLILVLAASGRRAAALATYAAVRDRLADELGVDPGPELRAAQREVLVAADRATQPEPPAVTPAQLPARLATFSVRAAELAAISGAVTVGSGGSVPVIAISGMGGVGKSVLAVRWAHEAAGGYPDGQLYVNLRGFDPVERPLAAAEALRGFLDALGVRAGEMPESAAGRAGLYRSLLSGRRVLVLLDNALDPAQVRPLLPGSSGCVVLVTSRNPMAGLVAADGARAVALDVLSPGHARALLAGRIGRDRVAAEPEAVDRLIERCARLPLALAIVAARAGAHRGRPLTALADELDAADGLDAFATGESGMDVRAVLSWSYHALAPEAAALFRGLATQPGPDASVALAASMAGLPERAVRPLLRELTGAHLITEHQPGRFVFHDLLRAYAGELARHVDDSERREAATRRMLDHYLHTAVAQAVRLNPYRAPITLTPPVAGTLLPAVLPAESVWFDTERDALLAAVRVADSLGLGAHVWQFVWALTPYLQDRRCYWAESTELAALALTSATRAGDRWWTGYLRNTLGRGYLRMGRYAESREQYEHAIAVGHETGNSLRLAHAYAGIAAGVIESDEALTPEQTAETEELLARAAALYRSIGSSHGEADVEQYLGDLFMRNPATLDRAGPHVTRAAALFRELGTRVGDAFVHVYEARRRMRDGDFPAAITHLQEAIGMYTETFVRAKCMVALAECHDRLGETGEAADVRRAALGLLDGFDNAAVRRLRAQIDGLDRLRHPA